MLLTSQILRIILKKKSFGNICCHNSKYCLYLFQRPSRFDGFTQVIANDRGHLLGGVPHSSENPWGKFVGTWDIPLKIPGNVTTFMARSDPAAVGIVKGRKDHEDYMRKAAGSPVKELAKVQFYKVQGWISQRVRTSLICSQDKLLILT